MFPLCRADTTTRVCSWGSNSVAARKLPYSCLRSHQRNENQLFRLARQSGKGPRGRTLNSSGSRQSRVFFTKPRTQVSWDPTVPSSCPRQKGPRAGSAPSHSSRVICKGPSSSLLPSPLPSPLPGRQYRTSFRRRLQAGTEALTEELVNKMPPESTF